MTADQVADCKNGHPLSGENLRVRVRNGRSTRECFTCRRAAGRDRHRAQVIAANPQGPDPSLIWDRGVPVDVWKRITVAETGCWLWTGSLNRAGYGRTTHGGEGRRYNSTHGLMYRLLIGQVPDGLELDHLCRVRHCCNPAHLEPVTHRENMLRGKTFGAANAAKTHCRKGHPYAGKNLGISRGQRWCRQCNSDYKKSLSPEQKAKDRARSRAYKAARRDNESAA